MVDLLQKNVHRHVRLPFGLELSWDTGVPEPEPERTIPQLSAAVSTTRLSGAPDTDNSVSNIDASSLAGRKSVENVDTTYNFSVWSAFAQRKKNLSIGLESRLDIEDFARMDFDTLAELMSDLSPEISKALWDFLLMCNGGYTCKALKPGTQVVDKKAQKILDDLLSQIGNYHGTTGVFFDRLFRTLFMRGSILLELVLDTNGDFIDIATPDTGTLRFKRITDPRRGQCWDFGQLIAGEFKSLNIPTVRYVPVHPSPDSIEGHSLCSAAFFCAIFLMSVLRDTKRIVQHQGYMRLDVEILFENLKEAMPSDIQSNPKKVKEWMDQVVAGVEDVYRKLKPDDTYIHSDAIKVNKPVGTANSDSLKAIDALFGALERMVTRALKSMPILMGIGAGEGRNETHANREWEIFAKGIETVQHFVESAFEYEAELALRAKGIQAKVEHRFAQFRGAELMRDAQVDMLRTQVARARYDCGYWSQDEAANYAADKAKADVPEPRAAAPKLGGQADNQLTGTAVNPDPSTGKSAKSVVRVTDGTQFYTIEEAEEYLRQYDEQHGLSAAPDTKDEELVS
jgi:hypothetical protein